MGLLAAIASYFLKIATYGDTLKDLMLGKYLYIGGFLYVFAALLNVYLLQVMPYSVVVPLCSVTYIWTLIIAYYLLAERITPLKMAGVSAIMLGAICVAVG